MEQIIDQEVKELFIVIIEDLLMEANYLKEILDEKITSFGHPFSAVKFFISATFEDYQTGFVPSDNSQIVFIVDIDLGYSREEEGFDILTDAERRFNNAVLIVNTGKFHHKDRCEEEMPDVEFIRKSGRSALKIFEIICDKVFNVSNFKKNSDSDEDAFVFGQSNQNDHKTNYIIVEDGMPSDFLSFGPRLSLSDYFLNPLPPGYTSHILNEKIWTVKNLQSEAPEPSTKKPYIIHKIDQQGKITGLVIPSKLDVIIDSVTHLDKKFDDILEFLKDNKTFESFLLEIFLAKRLVHFYLTSRIEADEKKIIGMARLLNEKRGKFVFMTDLWEQITKTRTRKSEFTNLELESIYKAGFIEIKDIFHCEVEGIDEVENMAKIRLDSVENEEISFYREVEMHLLEKSGISSPNTLFKLILFSYGENSDRIPGDAFVFIPTPPNSTY